MVVDESLEGTFFCDKLAGINAELQRLEPANADLR